MGGIVISAKGLARPNNRLQTNASSVRSSPLPPPGAAAPDSRCATPVAPRMQAPSLKGIGARSMVGVDNWKLALHLQVQRRTRLRLGL